MELNKEYLNIIKTNSVKVGVLLIKQDNLVRLADLD
jgi:hypothetical protein